MDHIIRTARNAVHAEPCEPDDICCYAFWKGSEKTHSLPLRPIDEYQATLDWALGMADCMVHPIYVMPLNYNDIVCTRRVERFLNLTGQLTSDDDAETWIAALTLCVDASWRNRGEAIRDRAVATLAKLGMRAP